MSSSENVEFAGEIPCPFVYANGKKCTGHVVRVEAYKADIHWVAENGVWHFWVGQPQSHYHVFCSEKSNHAGIGREDRLKFYFDKLPEQLQAVVSKRSR